MADSPRPPTPPDVKRALRKAGGFGCCRCGLPILQYHHIITYSIEQHFRVADMMVLCPTCHDMATKGALTMAQQKTIQSQPFNILRGYADGLLILNQDICVVAAGGTLLVGEGPLIVIDGVPLLELYYGQDGELQLSVSLYDRRGHQLALIVKNEWISGEADAWDIEADYQKLIVREKRGRVSLKIGTRHDVIVISAHLWHAGQLVKLSTIGLSFNGAAISNSSIINIGLVGMRLEFDTHISGLKVVPYLGKGFLVSEPDPAERIRKSVEAYNTIKAGN